MIYALISDIHGNAHALRLVQEDAIAHGAETFIYTGDLCISAPWPNEVIRLIEDTPQQKRMIRGNEEHYLRLPTGDSGQMEISRWCAGELKEENLRWLDTIPEQLGFEIEDVHVRIAHSSEAFIGDAEQKYFSSRMMPERYPDGPVSRQALLEDIRSTLGKDDGLKNRLAGMQRGVYVFGHTHTQWHAEIDGRLLINPGSCGLPLDCCAEFGAPYTLLTLENGKATVEERRVPYDVEKLICDVKKTSQYREAHVWSELIFEEWRSGREKVYYFLQHNHIFLKAFHNLFLL